MKQPVGLKRGFRTPFVKMDTHFARLNSVDLSCRLIDQMLGRIDFSAEHIHHVIWGMVVPDPDVYSIAREAVLGSRLDNRIEAYSVSRACATSLQAAVNAALYYNAYPQERSVSLVGGVESFSSLKPVLTPEAAAYFKGLARRGSLPEKIGHALGVPVQKLMPVAPSAREYSTGLTMGEHCELMVKEFKIARERQDRLAFLSHQNAAKARALIEPMILPVENLQRDTLIRQDASLEAMAKLRPAFDRQAGTITAGNASPFTDGAAGLFVVAPGLEPELGADAHLVDFEFVGVDPKEGLLIGPGKAMLRILSRQGLTWDELDYIEMHEAFAGQVLCNVDAINNAEYRRDRYGVDYDPGRLDETRLNPWGSSISYGHPFGATGARMLSQAIAYLDHNKGKMALVAACTAGALAGACLITRA